MIERDILPLSRVPGKEEQRECNGWIKDGLLDYALEDVGGEA